MGRSGPHPSLLDGDTRRRLQHVFEEHLPSVEKAALKRCGAKAEADDLMSEVRFYATTHPEKLLQHPNPRAWLLTVMHHRHLDHCRSIKPSSIESWDFQAVEDPRYERFETYESLKLATQALEPRLARVIELRLDGSTLEVIAREIGVSVAEAGRLVSRAQRQLSAFIKRDKP
jgi:RNA polymerase sigma-70 factor, ECF subfamily